MLERVTRVISFWSTLLLVGIVLGGLFVLPIFMYFSRDLPDYSQLTSYTPPTISRLYSSEGNLMAELAHERRIFRKINEMPQLIKNAFIAAEDQNYYSHPGIDITSILRAVVQNVMHPDRHPVGGSTITQQVVKNFLLNNERTYVRKIKEAILAYRINNVYTKDRILELYLNQIYLGNGAYGVTQASLNYFNKDLKYLTTEEAALLASMPKAPSILDKHLDKTKIRRDWVIERMQDDGYISRAEAKRAIATPIKFSNRYESAVLDNGYYTESVRLELIAKYTEDKVYQDGYTVHTNLNSKIQEYADEALRQGLIEYDRRHGFHGVLSHVEFKNDEWKPIIKNYEVPPAAGHWKTAIVLDVKKDTAKIGLKDGKVTTISLATMLWARERLAEQTVGKKVESVASVLKTGDIILISYNEADGSYALEQIPDVNGALVAMDAKTGKVLALVGGYSFKDSKYNRAIQALRQPGSVFKTFAYLAALEQDYPPNTIVRDEPVAISQGPGLPMWTPKNLGGKYLGPITLRKALEKSKNLATVNLVSSIGIASVAEVATRFRVYENPPQMLSMALGAYESTLMKLTAAFATFANGGKAVEGKLIDRVYDKNGKLILNSDLSLCENCQVLSENTDLRLPTIKTSTKQLVDPAINYQLVSILKGVVERGTAVRAKQTGKIIAGKTGTSNESNDTWFIGFSPDIVCGVFVGYDTVRTLGQREQGATLALPIFTNFMKKALAEAPNKDFVIPEGIIITNVDYDTGQVGVFSHQISEAFKPEQLKRLYEQQQSELTVESSSSSTENNQISPADNIPLENDETE